MANNQAKASHDKCHLLLSFQGSTCIQIEYFTIKYCTTKTLVGVNINNKLKFDMHAGINAQKTYRNSNALQKITNCMELPRNCILMNAFLYSTMN